MTVCSSRLPRRRAVSSSESGESETVAAFDFPPPQPGRRSSSSGRAVPMTRSGESAHPVDQVVDEVEQVVVGPVQILEDEHQRPTLGERLEEAAPGGESLVAAIAARLFFAR